MWAAPYSTAIVHQTSHCGEGGVCEDDPLEDEPAGRRERSKG